MDGSGRMPSNRAFTGVVGAREGTSGLSSTLGETASSKKLSHSAVFADAAARFSSSLARRLLRATKTARTIKMVVTTTTKLTPSALPQFAFNQHAKPPPLLEHVVVDALPVAPPPFTTGVSTGAGITGTTGSAGAGAETGRGAWTGGSGAGACTTGTVFENWSTRFGARREAI